MTNWQKGTVLQDGKYTIIKKLGEGGFGVTFLAKNNKGKSVVIKTLKEEIQQKPYYDQLRRDFYNEALRIARCQSDEKGRIVEIYKVIEEDKLPCIVMEYIPGKDLATIVNEKGILSEEKALSCIKQVGEALITVHKQGFLHRDIKPNNIIVRSDGGGVTLIDFGTAREFDLNETLTTRTAYSSGGYTPAEQYNPRGKQGPYTDVYALAGTLYFLLTKQIPPNVIVRNFDDLKQDPLKPLKTLAPHVSDRVNSAVMKGLSFFAKDRPQTMEEFLKLLFPDYDLGNGQQDKSSDRHTQKPLLLGILAIAFVSILGLIYYIFFVKPNFTKIELFEPQKGKIKLLYPNDWQVQREPITNELGKFISPKENNNDTFQESLIVSVESSDLSLEEYTEKTLQQINQNISQDFLQARAVTLDERQGTQVIYQRQTNDKQLKTMQSWTVVNNRAYIVTYTAEEDKFNKFQPIVTKMIDSMEIE